MMAKRIAQFHKVSFEQFAEGFQDTFGEMKEGELKEIYQSIKLPKRATAGSAEMCIRDSYNTVAKDKIAVIVNQKNPLSDITLYMLKSIYTGGVKNWEDLQ